MITLKGRAVEIRPEKLGLATVKKDRGFPIHRPKRVRAASMFIIAAVKGQKSSPELSEVLFSLLRSTYSKSRISSWTR